MCLLYGVIFYQALQEKSEFFNQGNLQGVIREQLHNVHFGRCHTPMCVHNMRWLRFCSLSCMYDVCTYAFHADAFPLLLLLLLLYNHFSCCYCDAGGGRGRVMIITKEKNQHPSYQRNSFLLHSCIRTLDWSI